MKIWFLTTSYDQNTQNGISTYLRQAARMYSESGHSVSIFTKNHKKTSILSEEKNIVIHRFHYGSPDYKTQSSSWPLAEAYALDQYLNIQLNKQKPDIIEVQDATALGYYVLMRKLLGDKRLLNIPIIVHLHMPCFIVCGFDQAASSRITNTISLAEKFVLQVADGFFCPSHFLYKQLKPYLRNDSPVGIIPQPFRPTLLPNKTNKDIDFLYLGRDEYRKGLKPFIKACATLWDRGERFSLTVVCSPPVSQEFGSLFNARCREYEKRGLLTSLPEIPEHSMVKEITLKAKWVVIPSYFDNYPITCLEAMAIKTPLLLSCSGGQAEIAPTLADGAIIFDWNISGDCEKKIALALSYSEEKRKQLGEKAYQRLINICNFETNLKQRLEYIINCKKNMRKLPYFPLASRTTTNISYKTQPINISIVKIHKEKNLLKKITQIKTNYIVLIPEHSKITRKFIKIAKNIFKNYPNLGYIYSWLSHKGNTIRSYIPEPPLSLYRNPIISPIIVNKKYILENIPEGTENSTFIWRLSLLFFSAGIPGLCIPQTLCSTNQELQIDNDNFRKIMQDFKELYKKYIYCMI